MNNLLITGGAGFIGCNLARSLAGSDCDVTVLDDLSLGRRDNLPPEVPLIVGDVNSSAVWDEMPGFDTIVHLAGASSAPMFAGNLAACFENNVIGFIRLLEHARKHGARRVVYASTSSVYGNVPPPLREGGDLDIPNFYAISKFCMEQLARMFVLQSGLDVVGLRFMSVYGPREDHKGSYANLVSQFIWEIEAGRSPTIYDDGLQTRDFTNVRDIVQAIRLCVAHPDRLGDAIFNVGTGQGISLNLLIEELRDLMEQPVNPKYIVNPVRSGYVRQQVADISRINRVLGYAPTFSLRDGIREILDLRRACNP